MEELINTVGKNYGIDVLAAQKIKNAYQLSTTEGLKCFKSSAYDWEQFYFIMSVLHHLEAKEFSGIPKMYRTVSGADSIEFQGRYGFLCDWVESREADFDNPIDVRLCVRTLAGMHLAAREFSTTEGSRGGPRDLFGSWVKRFHRRCEELLYFKAVIVNKERKHRTEFDSLYLALFDRHYRQAQRMVVDLENSSYYIVMKKHVQKSSFCHHDTANHNFLITEQLKTYIVDFDYCVYDTFLHDFASLLIRNLRHGNWSMARFDFISENYQQLLPLDSAELGLTTCLMCFPQDFWQVGLQYYVEQKSWEEQIFIKRLERVANDMRERSGFLSELMGRWSIV